MAHSAVLQEMLDSDEEYQSLTPDQQHVWLVLCITGLGGKAGLFQGGVKTLMRQTGRSKETVSEALDQFAILTWIIRDNDCIWVKNRIKHRCNSPNWRHAARREAKAFASKNETLAVQCLTYYDAYYRDNPPEEANGYISPLDRVKL